MRHLPALACLAVLLGASSARGGVRFEGGPTKLVAQAERLALRAQIVGFTWTGRSGRTHQPTSTPHPLSDLGALTPPPGEWDTVTLHLAGPVTLSTTKGTLSLPLRSLEVVLDEPLSGGAPIQLELDLALSVEALAPFTGDEAIRPGDPRLPGLTAALADGALLRVK